MQQANQVLSPSATLIPPHEAEQRTMDILRVVLKGYDIKKTYPSAPPLSEWCQLMLILGTVPSIPPDLPNVEEVFRAGLIERIIRYVVDFHSLPDQSNIPIVLRPGDEHGNVCRVAVKSRKSLASSCFSLSTGIVLLACFAVLVLLSTVILSSCPP